MQRFYMSVQNTVTMVEATHIDTGKRLMVHIGSPEEDCRN